MDYRYLEYILQCKGSLGGMMEEKELHNLLSHQLRDEVIEIVQGRIIKKHKIFKTIFTQDILDFIP